MLQRRSTERGIHLINLLLAGPARLPNEGCTLTFTTLTGTKEFHTELCVRRRLDPSPVSPTLEYRFSCYRFRNSTV